MLEGQPSPRDRLRDARRIVVKLGTHVVTHDGQEFALGRVFALVEALGRLRRAGKDVVVVSSGAVGLGRRALRLEQTQLSLGLRQACAAAGQGRLISLYAQAFGQLDVKVAQVLLTSEDLADPDRALCLRTTLLRLLELGAIPIINENDSVSVREIAELWLTETGEGRQPVFGENDGLAARVAVTVDADLLLLLTDVDGVYTANPHRDPTAQRIPVLDGIDDQALALAVGGSTGGTGGMRTKLEAARLASEGGVDVLIVDGHRERLIERALAADDIGTFIPSPERRRSRDRRILLAPSQGALVINDGAIRALVDRKASLLPIGVISVVGNFGTGSVIELRDETGRARGRALVNYDSAACRQLTGRHSSEIDTILGWRGYDALVTRDNLILSEPDS